MRRIADGADDVVLGCQKLRDDVRARAAVRADDDDACTPLLGGVLTSVL